MSSPTNLQFALFILVSIELTMFFILGGTDFGAGMATFFVKDNGDRDEIVRTSGPVWGGNETWLVAGMALVFGAFPHWYAALTSGFYLFFILLLVFFMFRGVAFDYRKKWRSKTYNRLWDWGLFLGSLVPPFILGIVFSSILKGVPIRDNFIYITMGDVFTPFTICSALLLMAACLQIGLARVIKKVSAELQASLGKKLRVVNLIFIVLAVLEVILLANATNVFNTHFAAITFLIVVIVVCSLSMAYLLRTSQRHQLIFWLAVVCIAAFMGIIFQGLYPNVIVNSAGPALSIMDAASGRESQLWVAVGSAAMLPLMTILQITAYHMINKYYDVPDSEINY
ncbi:cytochrome d ubiquinol oxidase subunit II [Enterococcus sp. LJL90]